MIDIENELFDALASKLRTKFTGISVYGEDVRTPSSFPSASILEADNYTLRRTQDSGSNENHAVLMYEVNVYSNKTTGKKSECKAIFSEIDKYLLGLGFSRLMKRPMTMDEATIYRMMGRYTAVVSQEHVIYRR